MGTVSVRCTRCGNPFMARTADRKRGWAKFCSKTCKAIEQTRRTGRGAPRESIADFEHSDEAGWDGHKDAI